MFNCYLYLFIWNLLSLLSSIFFNPVIVFIKEIFISHSKNVVTDKWRAVLITKNRFINQVRWILFYTIFFNAQKCVNKKTGKKSFSSHKLREKNYRKKSCIVFSMKSFFAWMSYSPYYMMCRWKCLFLVDALFNDSIFFDSETILLKGICISYSKNVETQRKEKADEICPYKNCSICSVGFFAELLCEDTKYLTKSQAIW